MDHAEAQERLELAAVEPGGLDRLAAAGDMESAAVVAHVHGCAACTAERDRLRRTADILGGAVRGIPSPDLRERTLAYIRAVGRPRDEHPIARGPISVGDWRALPIAAWAASTAAAVLVAVVATGWMMNSRLDAQLAEANAAIAEQGHAVEGLSELSDWTLRLSAEADTEQRRLVSPAGTARTTGTALFSPESGEVVMVASGLTPPPAGMEYRCWAELNGVRHSIGKMFFAGSLAYWVGDVEGALDAGSVIGISLVGVDSQDLSGEVTLRSRT